MKFPLLSFNNGEVSPYLRHRIDFEKTASSSETFRNFIATPYGAATKRPGLLHTAVCADSAGQNSHLFPFISTSGSRYLLHFTEDTLTIYRENGTVADSLSFLPATAPAANDGTSGFWSAPLRLLQIAPINDVLFITHPDTFPLRLSRVADADWTLEFIPFTKPPVLDENTDVNKPLSILSNPIADEWTGATSYAIGDTVFLNASEWTSLIAHVSNNGTRPGEGTDWKTTWRRKIYVAGDAVTITALDNYATAFVQTYAYGDFCYHTATASYYFNNTTHTPATSADIPGGASGYWELYNEYGVGSVPPGAVAAGSLYVDDGAIYRAISYLASTGSGNAPPNATYWTFLGTVGGTPTYTPVSPILAGTYVSFGGKIWLALNNVTPVLGVGGISNSPVEGVDWTEVSLFFPTHASSSTSPGSTWKIAPKRDEKDFQIEIAALTANNGKFSPAIAVQGAWNVNTFGTWAGTFTVQRSTTNGLTWETIRTYQATDDRNIADTGTEPAPVLLRIGFTSETATAASGKQRAVLTPEEQSISGYALADTYVNASTLTGTAATSLLSGKTPDWSEGAFSDYRGFPKAIALHESRLALASTASSPVSLWLSQTDDLINFEQGDEDTESVFVTLAAPFQYPIRWIASQRRLFLGTSVALWVAGSETSDAALSPSNFNARLYTSTGSHTLQPLLAADSLLFLDRKGSRLHQLSFAADIESYEPLDLSRLAEHLTQPGIAQIAWQQTREPCLWAVTREGNLLQFAYSRRDNIMAWTRHDSAGALFRNVAVLPSDNGDDDVFFILDRNGTTTLERFPQHFQQIHETGQIPGSDPDPLFPYHYLDGITYTGTATTTLTVPAHMVGEALTLVTVDAEGIPTVSTVTPGSTSLTVTSTSRAILGKPIDSRLSSLPIDMGETLGQRKRLSRITLSLYRSQGGSAYNANEAAAQPIVYPSPTDLLTGWSDTVPDGGNLDEAQLNIIHTAPYPFTIRAALIKLTNQER